MRERKPKKTPKTPGSRRWEKQRERLGTPEWWHDGVPRGQEQVAIRFVCRDHPSQVLGFFHLDTYEGAPTDLDHMGYAPLRNGVSPLSKAPDGHRQVRLICEERLCRIDVVYKAERVHRGLLAIWSSHARRVETVPVP